MQIDWKASMRRVRAALMHRGRSAHDADDLVQEAWLKMARYDHVRPVDRPEAFLMRVALNLSTDLHRSTRRRGEEVQVEEQFDLADTVVPGPEATVLARERAERLHVCLGRLSDKTRRILLAHRVDGLTYKQIAAQQGLSPTTVEWHVSRAVMLITGWMEEW